MLLTFLTVSRWPRGIPDFTRWPWDRVMRVRKDKGEDSRDGDFLSTWFTTIMFWILYDDQAVKVLLDRQCWFASRAVCSQTNWPCTDLAEPAHPYVLWILLGHGNYQLPR